MTLGPTARDRRLLAEAEKLRGLDRSSDLIDIRRNRDDSERYTVTFRCRGLWWPEDACGPSVTATHVLEVYLHKDFPRRPPQLIWQSEIFHPNILSGSRNGGVCIGGWSPAESLADLVCRIGEMVQMKQYGLVDPLDPDAAKWTKAHAEQLPVDTRPLVRAPERASLDVEVVGA